MIRLHWNRLKIQGAALKRIVQIGAPAALQSAVFSISNICIQTAINSFGSSAVAGMTAALNFEYIGYFIVSAFSQTVVTFIWQNYGAGQYGRCRKILRLCLAGTYEVVGSALRGMGRSTLPAVFTLFGTVVFRVFWVYAIFPLWNSFPALVMPVLVGAIKMADRVVREMMGL